MAAVIEITKARKAKRRAIDKGTRYDISGNLRRLVRRIENGDLQNVTDVVFVTRTMKSPDGVRRVDVYHCGSGSVEEAHWMMESASNRITP